MSIKYIEDLYLCKISKNISYGTSLSEFFISLFSFNGTKSHLEEWKIKSEFIFVQLEK